ncbi:MAG: SusC/RagA family TonB-linked outer membrane protein [Saprospiraceae bacterium]|nr:SusC/RagA family TonB-linked outer membrane protein [Saprospiraceae bacterium]
MKKVLFTGLAFLMALSFSVAQRMVKGTVTDKNGQAIIGANVVAKGSNAGTVTDVNGAYSLNVPAGTTALTISYTGYNSQDITLGASNMVDVSLSEGLILGEAVVTALGISRDEKSLTYGVSRVQGQELDGSGEVNAIQSLAAKVAGVQVIGSGGTPGASSKILIRGNNTFTGNNQPLIVIDGIPYDNQTNGSVAGDYPFNANLSGVNNSNRALDLNPADIESVNVLKGVAAATLYGTRAANGALVITTKRGKIGQKNFNINLASSIDVASVNKLPELQSTYGIGSGGGRFVTGSTTEVNPEGTAPTSPTVNSWGPIIPAGKSYDNLDAYFQNGTTFDNAISISGGNDVAALRFSYGNTDQKGVVPNTYLKRNTFSINANSSIGNLTIGALINFANTRTNKSQNGSNLSGVMLSLTRMPADFNLLGGNSPLGYENLDGSQHTYFPVYDNPLWSANHNTHKDEINRVTIGFNAGYKFNSWLRLNWRLGTDNYTDYRKQIFDILSNDPPEPIGEIWEDTKRHSEINNDIILTFSPKLSNNLSTSLAIGNNLNTRRDNDQFFRGRGLGVPGFFNISNASNFYASGFEIRKKLAGIFADLNLGWKDFLFVDLAARNDYASSFGEAKRDKGFLYSSAGASLVFTELMNSTGVLDFGKVRFAWGQAGIEPAAYQTRTYFNQPFITDGFTDGLGFPFNGVNGFGYSTQLGDPELEPEVVTGMDVGFDLRMFKNRLSLGFTYYTKKSTNLLIQRPIASSTGFDFIYTNGGEMENKGIELELGLGVINATNFKWDIAANFSQNKNKVLKLAPGVDEINIESAFTSIGSFAIIDQPYGALFATRWERSPDGQIVVGANGRPIVSATTGNIGNPFPDWIAGLRNTFTWKNLSLTGLLDFRQGGALWNGTYARLNRIGRTQESADDRAKVFVVDGVVKNADGTYSKNTTPIDAFTYYNVVVGDGAGSATENSVSEGSWIRLRELTLSYALKCSQDKLLKNASIYVTGRNLWLQTDYKGVDPETSLTGAASNVSGFDYFNFPSTKSVIFGFNLGF